MWKLKNDCQHYVFVVFVTLESLLENKIAYLASRTVQKYERTLISMKTSLCVTAFFCRGTIKVNMVKSGCHGLQFLFCFYISVLIFSLCIL